MLGFWNAKLKRGRAQQRNTVNDHIVPAMPDEVMQQVREVAAVQKRTAQLALFRGCQDVQGVLPSNRRPAGQGQGLSAPGQGQTGGAARNMRIFAPAKISSGLPPVTAPASRVPRCALPVMGGEPEHLQRFRPAAT